MLSEYGLVDVSGPVHINRVLREAGLLAVREELGLESLDAGASEAFAVSDHQVAHVYVRDPARIADVKSLLERVPGIDTVLDRQGQAGIGLDHERSGELVAISAADRWFTYYYWLDDRAGAGLRAHGRHPSQARLRPGRAVSRSGAAPAEAADRRDAREERRSASAI